MAGTTARPTSGLTITKSTGQAAMASTSALISALTASAPASQAPRASIAAVSQPPRSSTSVGSGARVRNSVAISVVSAVVH
ncbi:Uncharacterised protein [Mycobacteroides abscessus subsp. abscessus]|nr:Uncharacterised protein [Mycobacteroides abscessus subsp. abscessus]